MKSFLKRTLFSLLGCASVAQALEPIADKTANTLYFAPVPVVTWSLVDLDGGKSYLMLSYDYNTDNLSSRYQQLAATNPGMTLHQFQPEVDGDFSISIPSLNLQQKINPVESQYGPYFTWYASLTATQTQQAKTMVAQNTFAADIKITAPVKAAYQESRVLEDWKVSASICSNLLPGKKTLAELLRRFSHVDWSAYVVQHASVTDLQAQVLSKCYDVPALVTANSFKELLATPLQILSPESLTGRTLTTETKSLHFDLGFTLGTSSGAL